MNKITGLTLAVLMSMSVFSVSAAPIDTTKPIVKERTETNFAGVNIKSCLLYTSPSPRDKRQSRMPTSA